MDLLISDMQALPVLVKDALYFFFWGGGGTHLLVFILLSMDYGRIDLGGHFDGLYCGNVYNYLVTGIIFSDLFSL